VKRLLNDYTLGSDLDRQFGDLPVGLRKILLSMIHGFARASPSLVGGPPRYEMQQPAANLVNVLGRNWFKVGDICYRYLKEAILDTLDTYIGYIRYITCIYITFSLLAAPARPGLSFCIARQSFFLSLKSTIS
jgi:hypothetical protein